MGVEAAVQQAVETDTAGVPCGVSKWIRSSLRQLKVKLAGIGFTQPHEHQTLAQTTKIFA
ncbi:MAG: hypothetical protein HC903_07065 [Methylacidiphilales bacterium]|nr:hypothetical protein [Candidatus Methylacidiphilales bacterium]